jgi:hypothetical protein
MSNIICYSYEADIHCIDCTQLKNFKRDPKHPYAQPGLDENGVSLSAVDGEGNLVQPVFDTDGLPDVPRSCGTCGHAVDDEADVEPIDKGGDHVQAA